MSKATLLEMVNTVATELRFPKAANIIGNDDKNIVAIFTALKKSMERDVYRAHQWAALREVFNVIPDGSTEYWKLPLDYDSILNGTAWDVENKRPAVGSLDSYQWENLTKSRLTPSNQTLFFTVTSYYFSSWIQPEGGGDDLQLSGETRDCILFWPSPLPVMIGQGDISARFSVAYMKNWYILDASTNHSKQLFDNDGDKTILDSELIEQATLVRMLRTLGLGFTAEKEEFDWMLKDRRTKDGGMTAIDTTGPFNTAAAYPNTPGYSPMAGSRRWWG